MQKCSAEPEGTRPIKIWNHVVFEAFLVIMIVNKIIILIVSVQFGICTTVSFT
jgi:hypothetical protein